ncbi:MAG: hypothetical protein J6K29_11830 [Clostridia bacterium]|nr:hypothetical protein [Clostridia bacterium]
MKMDLFVLPSVMRRDFMEAFVLSREDFELLHPQWREELETAGGNFDEWYEVKDFHGVLMQGQTGGKVSGILSLMLS